MPRRQSPTSSAGPGHGSATGTSSAPKLGKCGGHLFFGGGTGAERVRTQDHWHGGARAFATQLQRFGKLRNRFRGRRSTFWIGDQISWQAQHFGQPEVRISFRSRCSTFARSRRFHGMRSPFARRSADFVAGAARFRKVTPRCRGRRSALKGALIDRFVER